jgi:hypothetical protein
MLQSKGRLGLQVAALALVGLGGGCNFLGIEPIELSGSESDTEPQDGGEERDSGSGGVRCDIEENGATPIVDEARDRCYLLFDMQLSFSAATAVCSGLRPAGSERRVYLASIGDPEELAFLAVKWGDKASDASPQDSEKAVWIGATDAKKEGIWTWRSGEDFGIGPCHLSDASGCWFWSLLEPNDNEQLLAEEDCAELTSSGKVSDKPCELARPFLCEYDGK